MGNGAAIQKRQNDPRNDQGKFWIACCAVGFGWVWGDDAVLWTTMVVRNGLLIDVLVCGGTARR